MGSVGFDAGWLAARRRYDEAALDPAGIQAIQTWAAELPPDRSPVVVDLGSGTGAALARARQWLAPRRIVMYAVDQDTALLAQGAAILTQGAAHNGNEQVVQLAGDLLQPLTPLGGPPDGAIDLVLGHALADLLPLDALAARVAALVRPGGLVQLALAYDGQTTFGPALTGDLEEIEAAVLSQFHQHMDRQREQRLSYGGSSSGRRLAAALTAAGLEILADAPSIWEVTATDDPDGERVLTWLLRFVTEAAREMGRINSRDLGQWEDARRSALAAGQLTARVSHRDVLARRPAP